MKVAAEQLFALHWLADGRALLSGDGAIIAVDGTTVKVTNLGAAAARSEPVVSPTGAHVVWVEHGRPIATVAPLADLTQVKHFDFGAGRDAECGFAGETHLACAVGNRLIAVDLATGALTNLAADTWVSRPIASPDGRFVAYPTKTTRADAIAITPVDHAAARPLAPTADDQLPLMWLP